eukprot:6878812-Pyramimonas_sp.AAC.1
MLTQILEEANSEEADAAEEETETTALGPRKLGPDLAAGGRDSGQQQLKSNQTATSSYVS